MSTKSVPPVIFIYPKIKKIYMEDKTIVTVVVCITILSFIYGFLYYTPTNTEIITSNFTEGVSNSVNTTKSIATINVPAVDDQGNGVSTTIKVEAMPGEGRVLTDINNLLFWVDTQYSIQIAKSVAENVSGVNASKVDLVYAIETDASLIEGPSAGASLTVATIAVLENKTLNKSVVITGTINPDGSIGWVGGILAKAKAAKDIGSSLFLVPKGQGTQTSYQPVTECKEYNIPGFYQKVCNVEYKEEKIDITKDAGIEVKEVSNIRDALKYFIN